MAPQLLLSTALMLRENGTIMLVVLEGEIQACNRAREHQETLHHAMVEKTAETRSTPQ